MTGNLNIALAFVAGLVSFLSPCVLPLVPSYLAQLVGPGVLDASSGQPPLADDAPQRAAPPRRLPAQPRSRPSPVVARAVARDRPRRTAVATALQMKRSTGADRVSLVPAATSLRTGGNGTAVTVPVMPAPKHTPLWHSIAFVAGFSVAFIALGATASVLGTFLREHQQAIARVGGVLLVILGLHFAGVIKIPLLYREGRVTWRPARRGYPASFLIGLIFALGWTPCIGVILTGILILAAQSTTLASGIVLLAAYSLGLGLPFIAMGAAFSRMRPLLRRMTPYLGAIERATGVVIAAMGVIIFNGWLLYLNQYFTFGIKGF